MRTELRQDLLATSNGQEADSILRSCVQCGFCTATCPTYQELGDELDGPRGRIWLIKELMERGTAGSETQLHLDRCLSCRACETTCPSGVRYGRLLELGREELEAVVPRSPWQRLLRSLLVTIIPYRKRLAPLLRVGQSLRPLLPAGLRQRVPVRQTPLSRQPESVRVDRRYDRLVILPHGCVQALATPATRAAAVRVLQRRGIGVCDTTTAEGCCGALPLHLDARERARELARRNIDSWWPQFEQGAERLVATASGCGLQLREYGTLLADDPAYAERAAAISGATVELAELIEPQPEPVALQRPLRVAWQSPCTLQHGMGLRGQIEALLAARGVEVVTPPEAHLCCGSAGTYSLLQPELATRLRERKLAALGARDSQPPDMILTANVGCQLHLAAATDIPVRHWIELLDYLDLMESAAK